MALFCPAPGEGSHVIPYIPGSCLGPTQHVLLGLRPRGSAIGIPMNDLVQERISVSRTSAPSICHDGWLFAGVVGQGNGVVYALDFRLSLKVL